MEKEFSEPLSSSDFQTMDESLEFIFTTMVDQGEMLDAVEFIRSIEVQFLPSTTTMKTLIFQIIMNSDDIKTIAFATDYLYTVVEVYPPVNEKRRKFYFDSIRDDQGFLADLWTVFNHIVISNIIQKGIYVVENNHTDPIKYPNCKFLLEFYIKLFMADFHHYKSDNSTICLISKLFWPNSDIRSICLSNQTNLLFKWINDIYASASVNEVPNLIESMHQMLTLVVRCIIEGKHNFSESEAFSSAPLAEIVVSIAHNCKDALSNLSNVKKFLNFIPDLKYLRMKLCEKLIKQLIKVSSRKYSVLTLKDIVEQCMFPSKLATLKNNHKTLVMTEYLAFKPNTEYSLHPYNLVINDSYRKEKKELRRRVVDKKYFTDMKMETTKLHELCKKNKFADLLEELTNSSDDINARDPNGNTPLHEACSVGSRLCVRHLIDEGCSGTAQTLDFAAFNLEGVTPLHVAVVKDFVDIAKMLLSFGGAELLTMSDNKGQLPADLSKSDSMDKLLQEYDSQLCAKLSESSTKDPTESDSSTESALLSKENLGSAPSLKSFREYSIYLDCLTCLLCTYCDMFNLHDYVWQKNTTVSSHNDKCCCHYVDKDVCSEDAAIISELPSLIETFMESITKNASKCELLIDIELIPLKGFVASLKTS